MLLLEDNDLHQKSVSTAIIILRLTYIIKTVQHIQGYYPVKICVSPDVHMNKK